jgi:hypothetical protein
MRLFLRLPWAEELVECPGVGLDDLVWDVVRKAVEREQRGRGLSWDDQGEDGSRGGTKDWSSHDSDDDNDDDHLDNDSSTDSCVGGCYRGSLAVDGRSAKAASGLAGCRVCDSGGRALDPGATVRSAGLQAASVVSVVGGLPGGMLAMQIAYRRAKESKKKTHKSSPFMATIADVRDE